MTTFLSFLPLIIVSLLVIFMGILIIDGDRREEKEIKQKLEQEKKSIILVS